jgi:hypothetical protein
LVAILEIKSNLKGSKMQKLMMGFLIILAALFSANSVNAAADLEVNTPAIAALKNSMQARHTQLAPHYGSGAIGWLNRRARHHRRAA